MAADPTADPYRFVGYRRRMIESIRSRGIEDLEILQLFDEIPRHVFIPEGVWNRAYEDAPVPIGYGQTASQPSLQAYYLQVLAPQPHETVLEIGTGSAFLTALLARCAERVFSVERERGLSQRGRQALDRMGITNALLLVGDGTIGLRKHAPYDVIVVSAGSPSVPPALVEQLAEGGRMLIPVGDRVRQELILVERKQGRILQSAVHDHCAFVPLVGQYGWAAEDPSLDA